MDLTFFRPFFIDNASLSKPLTVHPAEFDSETHVVIIELDNSSAGEILGVSKVKGGNRMATTYLRYMSVVCFPKEEKCRLWLSVSNMGWYVRCIIYIVHHLSGRPRRAPYQTQR